MSIPDHCAIKKMLMWLQGDRVVRSYESFRYAPGYYIEDTSADWWNPAWGSQMQLQRAQQYGQPHDPQQQYIQGEMPAPVRGEGLPMVGPAGYGSVGLGSNAHGVVAQGLDRRSPTAPGPATSGLANSETSSGTARRSRATHRPIAPRPAASDPAASAGSRPPAMPQLDPKVHNAELPPPQPPAGFNDQPPPRMYPEMYLPRHHERAPRNAQWPLNIEISLVEICTFCPSWFMIPEAVGRAIRNGWSREALTKAELLAENPVLDYGAFTTRHGRIQKQISQGAKMLNGVAASTRHHSNTLRGTMASRTT